MPKWGIFNGFFNASVLLNAPRVRNLPYPLLRGQPLKMFTSVRHNVLTVV